MRNFWNKHKQTLTIALALAAMMLAVIMAQAATSPPKTVAEAPAESEVTFDTQKNKVFTADDGIIVIPAAVKTQSDTAVVAEPLLLPAVADASEPALLAAVAPVKRDTYTLPEQAQMKNGSLGVLSIPKIGLSVNVYETDDEMEAMTRGLAHFKTTSAFDGNTGMCGHNVNLDGSAGYFYNLHKLVVGDTISYKTALGQRSYTVETVKEIAETDWSYLGRTEDNRVTLITCITGKVTKRLMVQAVEKG